ncbi:YceI family protein [Flavobacterium eburneipallidum]|uniref:YceI family protein n=1 Tax=Flavobacterium eburneipallidum TaxID=3003263 RepID=UPI0024826DB5|nr:YceI family protein [Flavobacterium eburneipallidum]
MKEIIVSALFILAGNLVFSQKMMTRTGEVKFEASMPAFEEVAATNKTTSCILDKATGDFVALTLIKAFKFKAPLMEEHFNENYMESSQFPKATFKGKILNFDAKNLSATKTSYDLEGDLTIHGVTKKVKTKINLTLSGPKILVSSAISVKPQDYKIEIPSLVKGKIADNVKVTMNFILGAN